MALFVKKFETETKSQLYSIGLNRTYLIVGLGNDEAKYDKTRHNVGFKCVEFFAEQQEFPAWLNKKDLKSHVATKQIGSSQVILAKPTTYMNNSGEAVQAAMHFYHVNPNDVLVVYDDIDIKFGSLRTRVGGDSAGHNGIKSLIEHCGNEFGRIKVGIGPKAPEQIDSADFVLAKFTKDEQTHLDDLYKEVSVLLTEYIYASELPNDTRQFIF